MKPHIIVFALAGTGKTLTLVEGVKQLRGKSNPSLVPSPQQAQIWKSFGIEVDSSAICFAAFSVPIKDELIKRIDKSLNCHIATIHSLGFRAIRNEVGLVGGSCILDKWKTNKLIMAQHGDMSIRSLNRSMPGYCAAVRQLVRLSKYATHTNPSNDELSILAAHYGVSLGQQRDQTFDTTRNVLQAGLQNLEEVDFDDMPWMPVVLDLPLKQYDTLLVDEAQDLNHCQQELIFKSGSRIIAVGDKHQAIYGFAGADTKSMDTMREYLQFDTYNDRKYFSLPLTISRRCSQAVAEEAKKIVPEFEAHQSNTEGSVISQCKYGVYRAKPGNMILCRVNAPLVAIAFQLISQGIPARIIGRDIKGALTSLISMLEPNSVADLEVKLIKHENSEVMYLMKQKPVPQMAILAIQDKCKCLRTICLNTISIADVVAKITELFNERVEESIRLSSIHRAKGLEATNVFIIKPELLPHPLASLDWEVEQEENLKYVAITRAKENLIWVRS